jgi:hypothetical protein
MSLHVGDIGAVIRRNLKNVDGTVLDISSATTKEIVLLSPSGDKATKTAAFTTNGTDGKLQYTTTITTDLHEPGVWRAEAHVILSSGEFRSDAPPFVVSGNL